MNISSRKELAGLKRLYAEGFKNDSKAYIDFFFEEYIPDGNALTYSENGKLICAGYIAEKPAKLFARETVFPYISALSTYPEYRGKDKIRNVILKAYDVLREKGHAYFGLHPFNYIYYKKFSIGDISYCEHKTITGGVHFAARAATKKDYKSIFSIYESHTKKFDNKLILDNDTLVKRIHEYEADGADCIILSEGGKDFCFVFSLDSKLDYYCTLDENLLNKAENFKNCAYYDYSVPHYPYLQGRIINAQKALTEYNYDSHINTAFNVRVYDPDITDNNFYASLSICGGCAELSKPLISAPEIVFDIQTLTEKMFTGGAGIFKKQTNFFPDKF